VRLMRSRGTRESMRGSRHPTGKQAILQGRLTGRPVHHCIRRRMLPHEAASFCSLHVVFAGAESSGSTAYRHAQDGPSIRELWILCRAKMRPSWAITLCNARARGSLVSPNRLTLIGFHQNVTWRFRPDGPSGHALEATIQRADR